MEILPKHAPPVFFVTPAFPCQAAEFSIISLHVNIKYLCCILYHAFQAIFIETMQSSLFIWPTHDKKWDYADMRA